MEKEKGVPEVDFPLLTHLLFYVPQISQIYTDLETCSVFEKVKILRNLWDIKIFSEKKNLRAQILYFILREMTHDETATEAQYQNDDGEHHGCSIGSVLYIFQWSTQLEKYA